MWRTHGKIMNFTTREDIKNNDMYVIDRESQEIFKPISPDDWWNNEVVWVYNAAPYNKIIRKGEMCRCWRVWLSI